MAIAGTLAASLLTMTACDLLGSDGDGADSTGGSGAGSNGSGPDGSSNGQGEPAALTATLATASEGTAVIPGDSVAELAAGTTQRLFESAPVVVLAADDEASAVRAASAAVALGVPVVIDGDRAAEEVDRLGADVALAIGPVDDPGIDVVVPADDEDLARLLGIEAEAVTVDSSEAARTLAEMDPNSPQLLVLSGAADVPAPGDGAEQTGDDAAQTEDGAGSTAAPLTSDRDELPSTSRPAEASTVTVLSTGATSDVAALGVARAAGATVLVESLGDPRATSDTVQALADDESTSILGLGDVFGDDDSLGWKVATARTGVELPGGGQLALPGKTYIALYGTPSTPSLGVLGEQPIEQTITRAEEHAGWYEPLTDETVIPTLEIIATVASAGPGADGNYSNELPMSELRPLIDLAAEHDMYVVLDLQPGRNDFLTQAKRYEELLLLPHVGLALDPEWRLRPDQVHLQQIGTVSVEEVNEVITWLADLTRDNDLPQKVLVLHMFQLRMIPEVDTVDQSREELAVLIHADGQGAQPDKQATWRALHDYAPSIKYWGWKNFYDEDTPMLSAEETMTYVDPLPDFVSYQ
ncbi:hypothetical protein ACQBAT_05265 [Ornithinimicrobium sp. Y1847]|uniref:hypothetical protein n=1 Tax=Ornithinimicrobium sp. Y1847 TaxID=3405419 RepID=UPI003B67FAD2